MITSTFLWHVLLATVSGYIIGGLWYSPLLFMKPWMRGVGKTEADLLARKNERPRVMLYTFIIVFATAFGLSALLTLLGIDTVIGALQVALLVSFSFVITSRLYDMLYVSREPHWSRIPQQLFLVEAGHSIASLSSMAVVFTLLS